MAQGSRLRRRQDPRARAQLHSILQVGDRRPLLRSGSQEVGTAAAGSIGLAVLRRPFDVNCTTPIGTGLRQRSSRNSMSPIILRSSLW
jgi:hypothetical protein